MKDNRKYSKKIITLIIVGVVIVGAFAIYVKKVFFTNLFPPKLDKNVFDDVSRLNKTKVHSIVQPKTVGEVREALEFAKAQNIEVSIAGKRHSMGGHTLSPNALLLDMTQFNEVIDVDVENRTLRIQSGATWDDAIREVNKHDLAIPVLQDYSSFSIGGSLGVNIHESDPNFTTLIDTVRSFRILLADGSIQTVSRTQNPNLFALVIGGYGLFGVVLDVELDLVPNAVYKKNEWVVDYKEYEDAFKEIRKNTGIENIFGRLSIVPGDSFLKDVVVTTYEVLSEEERETLSYRTDLVEDNVFLKKIFFDASRENDLGKQLRWQLQKNFSNGAEPPVVTRNNLDYNDASFLEYYGEKDTDILQEYFFPMDQLPAFLDSLREIMEEKKVNLLSATIRYVEGKSENVLSYSKNGEDRFAVVLYFNVGRSTEEQENVKAWTQELVQVSIDLGGTYYLPYELYATGEQLVSAYPRISYFFNQKKRYDPNELFVNKFYTHYVREINR